MPGIFFVRGGQLRFPEGSIRITIGDDGEPTIDPVTPQMRLDLWPQWLHEALDATVAARDAHAVVLAEQAAPTSEDHLAAQLGPGWNLDLWHSVNTLVENRDNPGPLNTPPTPSRPLIQRQIRLNPDQAAALVTDYEAGASIADLARKYNVHVNTATRHITKKGLPIRHQHGIPEDQLETARALYNAGWTYKQIGAKYGTSRTTVSNQLNGRA